MKHEERIRLMKAWHTALLKKLESSAKLPASVRIEKLEDAYDKLSKEYVFVLRKRRVHNGS